MKKHSLQFYRTQMHIMDRITFHQTLRVSEMSHIQFFALMI